MRSITSGPASAGGRPVIALRSPCPDASASRQPCAPQPHTRAVGLDDDVADVAGVAGGAVEQAAVEHDPAADAGRHDHGDEVALAARPRPPSPRRGPAPWRRCRRTPAARSGRPSRSRSGKSRHAGMLSGDTVSPPGAIGPPQPTPHTTDAASPARRRPTDAASAARTGPPRRRPPASASTPLDSSSPAAVDQPGRQLGAADVDGQQRSPRPGRTYRGVTVVASRRCAADARTSPRPAPRDGDLRRPVRRRRRQHRAGHPGQARGHRAGAALPRRRGPPAHRGRARRRQDQPGQGAGHVDRLHASAACSSRPTCCRPTSSASPCGTGPTASSSSGPGPSSPTSSWPTRSTGPRRRPSRRCSRPWPRARSPSTARPTRCRRPFMVIATQNPIEHEGTYPLPGVQLDRFLMRVSVGYPAARRRARDPRHPRRPRRARRHRRGGHRRATSSGMVDAARGRARGAQPQGLPRRPGRRVPPPSRTSPSACRPGRRSRLQRVARARAAAARPHLRRPRRPQGAGRAGARPPPPRHARGPAPGHHRRPTRSPRCSAPSPSPPASRGSAGRADPPGLARRPRRASRCSSPAACSALVELFVLGAAAVALLVVAAACSCGHAAASSRSAASCHPPRVHAGTPSRVELTLRNLRRPAARRCCGCATRCRAPGAPTCSLAPARAAGDAHGRRVPAADRPPRHRRRSVRSRSIVADPFGLASVATVAAPARRAHRLPARRRHRRRCPTPPATTRTPAPSSPTRSAARARTSTPCAPTSSATTCAASTGRRPARHDELMVRQDELPWQGRTTVLLDVRRSTHTAAIARAGGVGRGQHRHRAAGAARDLVRLLSRPTAPTRASPPATPTSRRSWSTSPWCAATPGGTLRGALDALETQRCRRGAGGRRGRHRPGRARRARAGCRRRFGSLTVVQFDRSSWDPSAPRAGRPPRRCPCAPRDAGALVRSTVWNARDEPKRSGPAGRVRREGARVTATATAPATAGGARPLAAAAGGGRARPRHAGGGVRVQPAVRRRDVPAASCSGSCSAATACRPCAGGEGSGWRLTALIVGGGVRLRRRLGAVPDDDRRRHPDGRHARRGAGRPDAGVGAVPGRGRPGAGGARLRARRRLAVWIAGYIADWAAFRLWVPFEAIVPAGTLFLFASLFGAPDAPQRRHGRVPRPRCSAFLLLPPRRAPAGQRQLARGRRRPGQPVAAQGRRRAGRGRRRCSATIGRAAPAGRRRRGGRAVARPRPGRRVPRRP